MGEHAVWRVGAQGSKIDFAECHYLRPQLPVTSDMGIDRWLMAGSFQYPINSLAIIFSQAWMACGDSTQTSSPMSSKVPSSRLSPE